MHMPLSMLARSPFRDFLIPGLILGVGLGLGAFLVAAALVFRPTWPPIALLNPVKSRHWSWTAALLFGLALMVWIIVQVAMIGGGSWLQPFYFGGGSAIVLASLAPSVRAHLARLPEAPSNPRTSRSAR